MRRLLITAAAFATLGLAVLHVPSTASTRVGVSINIGDPYRGAALHFRSEPDVVLVPNTRVYYVRDYGYDVYRYGRYWYFIDNGRWYRARTHRGPFLYIHTSTVPRSIVQVPPRYRRRWGGPPPHAVARGYHRNHDVRDGMWSERHKNRVERRHDIREDRRGDRDEKNRGRGKK
jgi:hypothetical protein